MSASTGGSGGGGGTRVEAGADMGGNGGILIGNEKRPIRPKLLKLSDVTIPHRNRKKTKTKSKDRSGSTVRDRIFDDPAYTDDISHLANPIRRSSVNVINSELLNANSAKVNSGGSSSLGKRSKLTKEFKKLAQEDIGHIAFSSSEEDLRYQRAASARSEGMGRGRSLERSRAVVGEKLEKRRPEKRNNKQKRNLSLDNKCQQLSQETKETNEVEHDRPPEPPQRLALTRHNLGKQRSDEAAWQRQQSQLEFPASQQDNEDVFSLHSSAKENVSVAASTIASLSTASTSKIQMGKRFLKGEIGIKSFNYYLLKEGLKSSKKFVEKQKSNFQTAANTTTTSTLTSSAVVENTTSMPVNKNKLQANSEENIYEEIFFKDAPITQEDDENKNPSKSHKQQGVANSKSSEPNMRYADCELCMQQQCDKGDCEYCFRPELTENLNQNRAVPSQTFNKSTATGNRLNATNLNNNTNSSASRTALESQLNTAPILEFQSYNPNNPGVYKIETTPVAITGDYNPILQFQQPSTQTPQMQHHKYKHAQQHQSTSTTSTATTTPSEQHLQHQHQHQQQSQLQQQQQQQQQQYQHQPQHQQQQFYGYKNPTFYSPHAQSGFWPQTSSAPRPRTYVVASHFPSNISSNQRMNTKSSSSSDSLQQQHKFNTFTHVDGNFINNSNAATIAGRLTSASSNYLPPQPLQPLLYGASKRLGGSQILVDNSNSLFENPPQIYKSDSRASILSEYSLSRSSDTYYGSHRYGHHSRYYGGGSNLNDHNSFENSLMLSYASTAQRRYFGSAESCRFGYDCRRCSLDSGRGAGLLANHRGGAMNASTQNNLGITNPAANEKCSFSDHCKYDCRNCDCSSVYFSSDFDEVYSGGGIPRKTAKGTLPSTGGQPPPPALENFDLIASSEKQQALKQNKYAQDFFKHVNDVKRSIYQAEMQRNGNMESLSPKKSLKKDNSVKGEREIEILGITTLPLAKERVLKPTPAPRTSLQQQTQNSNQQTTPQPLQRRLPAKSNEPSVERKEYASLDRLIASNKGAIPKITSSNTRLTSPHGSPKLKTNTLPHRETPDEKPSEQHVTTQESTHDDKRHVKKYSKEISKITSSSLAASLSGHRRKDIPAPPPPSPATYADLQELQQNVQDTMRDDTKQDKDRKGKRNQHDSGEYDKQQQESATTITKNDKDEEQEEEQQSTEISLKQQQNDTKTTTIFSKTMQQQQLAVNNGESKLTTKDSTDNTERITQNTKIHNVTELQANTVNTIANETSKILITGDASEDSVDKEKPTTDEEAPTCTAQTQTQTQASSSSLALVSLTSASSSIMTAMDFPQRDQTETYDDDVFYDARSEDSACTAASSSMASNAQLKQEQHPKQERENDNENAKAQEQQSCKETKCKQSEQVQQHLHETAEEEEYLENLPSHQQDTNDENQQQQKQILENKETTENEQQHYCPPQPKPSSSTSPSTASAALDYHTANEAKEKEQQMNKNEVENENKNCDIKNVKQPEDEDNVVASKQILTNNGNNPTAIATSILTNTDTKSSKSEATINTALTSSITADINATEAAVIIGGVLADSALELKVNKQSKRKQQLNEHDNKNEFKAKTNNNNDGSFVTKDNDKTNKNDNRETKRIGKHKRDYKNEEEKRESKLRNSQQQQLEDEKQTAKSSTSLSNKKQRQQRRSPSSTSNSNVNNVGGASAEAGGSQKLPTSTLSCDTCCQLEWSQQHNAFNSSVQQQQHSPQTLKPPTLHIGMVGQPARVTKRKTSSSSSTSRERANKTKHEIKTKIIYSQEKPESTTTTSTTTTTTKSSAATRETGISTTFVAKINKSKEKKKEVEKIANLKEKPKETATCSLAIKSTKNVETTINKEEQAQEQTNKKEKFTENPDILQEIKEISKAILSLQHDAETSDSVTLAAEQHVAATKTKVDDNKVEEKLVALKIKTTNTTNIDDDDDNDDAAAEAPTIDAGISCAATVADHNVKEEVNTVIVTMDQQQTAKETVDVDADADVAAAAATTTDTVNDSKTTTTNISYNSEFAGVTTYSPHNSSSPIVPLITTLQSSLSQESDTRRPPLIRQDYSCFDSSEAQSDDSHLTRDSITRESQNDELSSSTLDKIDVSTLPLPALPPKKRRTKLRASPSKHHHCRGCHESPQKYQQQQELRDPHDSPELSQLNADGKYLSAFEQYVAKRRESLEASSRSFNEKLESRRMHYHMGGAGAGGIGGVGATGLAGNSASSGGAGLHVPTYLFGEQCYTGLPSAANRKSMGHSSKEEIYLNKSGWVQVNTKRANDENRGYRRANHNHQNGDLRNTIRVIQIDNTKRSDMTRQALLQHQHSMMEQPRFVSSKVEELIQRNEARLINSNARDAALRPGYRIVDPQLASILNERPGFLPVKNLIDHDSPPPITPILSPPPAFQDSSVKLKSFDRRRPITNRLLPQHQHHVLQPNVILTTTNLLPMASNGVNNKGMVFSRSFEYDNRRPTPTDAYVETFSRSFDGNLTERVTPTPLPRDRSPNFSNLTGNSPNYLTKKDSGGGSSSSLKSRESSPKYQSPVASISSAQSPQNQKTTAYLNTSVKEAPPSYSVASHQTHKYSPRSVHHERSFERSKNHHNVLGRSRKSQFSRSGSGSTGAIINNMGVSRFRSFDTTASQRLNSCDSGARSDLSNDELDIEEDDAGSSEFLNTNSYHPVTSPFKTQRQRSLTPDRNESHSSSSSLRKQRSITPESRSLTPEDRRKKGSQVSLTGSRQNSSSRSNTLERKHEKLNISRSSSSSSYSGREHDSHSHSGGVGGVGGNVGTSNVGVIDGSSGLRVGVVGMNTTSNQHRRSLGRNAKQVDDHRIRRSRSLQLTERSPNRGHKMMVCVGQNHTNTNQPPLYQQSNMRSNFPPTIRTTTGKSQSIMITNTNGGVTAVNTRQRQNDIDKSRSFDFDYCNFNAHSGSNVKSQHSNSSLIGSQNLLNREAALRLDFDKSRSFEEDYSEAVGANNNLNANAMRYLQTNENSDRNHKTRLRRSSPVEGNGRNTRSPQSSGSSCNNLNVPRNNTSPQNYGTRLCDHEMTYDLMRKSLDRSPIMDFRRGDSKGGGDYDVPIAMLRNRETINSGGNTELNFMNSGADNLQYNKHLSSNSLKQQRSLRRTQSPNETHYSLERAHTAGSRDDITPNEPNEYRNEYNEIYRNRTRTTNRGSDFLKLKTTNLPLNNTITTTTTTTTTTTRTAVATTAASTGSNNQSESSLKSCLNQPCSYWPQCGACQNLQQQPNYEYLRSLPLKRNNSYTIPFNKNAAVTTQINLKQPPATVKQKDYQLKPSSAVKPKSNKMATMLKINLQKSPTETKADDDTASLLLAQQTTALIRPLKSTTQWTLLCKNALASKITTTAALTTITTNQKAEAKTDSLTIADAANTNTVVNVPSYPALRLTAAAKLMAPTNTVTTATNSKISTLNLTTTTTATTTAVSLTANTATLISVQKPQPRVIPLAATSLVFLGDFEIPVTQNHNNSHDIHETSSSSSSSSPSLSPAKLMENNVSAYETKIQHNLQRLYANTTTNEMQTRKFHKNKIKDKTANTLLMHKIIENKAKDDSSANSSSSNSSNSNCNETSIANGCGYEKQKCHNNCPKTTTSYAGNCRKRKSIKLKASKTQRHCRRPRMSLPNIWLNLNEASEKQNYFPKSKQQRFARTATTNDGISVNGVSNGFPMNLSHQIRAVSSPSLTTDTATTSAATTVTSVDNNALVHQRIPSSNSSYTTTSQEDCQIINNNNTAAAATANTSATTSASTQTIGVLQKFKRTLTNFNKHQQQQQQQPPASNQTTTATALVGALRATDSSALITTDTDMQTDVTDGCTSGHVGNKYRFGPLVWRTSKERRKTKYNRRDKCNSGDSGIQIELENDEQFARVMTTASDGLHLSTLNGGLLNMKQDGMNSLRVRTVRRTNSAKVTAIIDENAGATLSTTKLNILKCIDMHSEREAPESLPTRSLSQPNGLESCGMTRNDLDDSDSDSVTSHEEASSYYPIYAEVLYNFTAAGPQELSLEKGTLIEILRKEIGPWWFGRIKKEDASLVEEILAPDLGWFPKEFVRVINTPDTDYFYLQHMAEQQHLQQQQQQHEQNKTSSQCSREFNEENTQQTENRLLNTSSSAPCSLASGSMPDGCNTAIIDQHNVTTIVIESSSSPPSSMSTPHYVVGIENKVTNDATAKDLTLTTANTQAILSTSQSLNVIMDSADILRRSAIKELLDTEVNYVKLLSAICEGYLPAMNKRIDIFSPNSIRLIFSNITAIYKFQRKFLESLRKAIEQNQVAKVFLKMHKGFLCYSTYCNAYPRALIELASYERVKDARTILDNCRESENLAELPLSAHLLAPVQRICRYPLHLGELIKSSAKGAEPPAFSLTEYEQIDVSQLDIPDTTETIDMALEAMKSVTEAVNEGKRHSETIARHQASFQNFKGPPLHLHSTRFFLQIDATRQKQNLWNSSCTLFLFDNQLVYCKRDIIKRSNFIYKGRIFLDRCRVVNVRDGKMFGHTIKNSLRIYCEARDKWFDFSFRSANRKHRFLNTLALERQFGGKSLYIAEMTGFEYAFGERDYSDQSDYEVGDSGEQKFKEFVYESNANASNNTNNTSGESSVPESPAKSFKYSDTLPHKKSQRLDTNTAQGNETQTGSLGRRRLGNWFRKPKSTASTPNHSPTHKPTQTAHSTGDLQLTSTELTETYAVLQHAENGGGVSS